MPEGLAEAIGASVDVGDTAPATPETATTPEVTTPAAAPETAPADTAAPATGGEEFLGDEKFDWASLPPEQVPLARQLQADYTRKTQALAEQRKALEGVDEGSLNWMKQFQAVAQTNPTLAAQMLEAERQKFLPQAPTDPFEGQQWLSDGERALQRELLQQKQIVAELQQAHGLQQINQRFDSLEKEVGRSIPQDERERTATYCLQRGIRDPGDGWRAMNWAAGIQMGRDQAAGVVAQKQGMGAAPGGVASREAPASDRQPKTAREAITMAYEEAERRSA
jgi:hypothetical protein